MSDTSNNGRPGFEDFMTWLRVVTDPAKAEEKLQEILQAEKAVAAREAAVTDRENAVTSREAETEEKHRQVLRIWKVVEERDSKVADREARHNRVNEETMALLQELGIREMPHNVLVDGSSTMTKVNPHYVSITDQIRRLRGRPSEAQEAEENRRADEELHMPALVIVPMGGAATGSRAIEVARPRKRRDSHA